MTTPSRMPFAAIKRGAEDLGKDLDAAIARFKTADLRSREEADKALDALDKDLESIRRDITHYRYGSDS